MIFKKIIIISYIFQFICGSKELHAVKNALEKENHNVTYSEYEYLPVQMYPLDEQGFAALERLISKLYQRPDVVRVFDNAVSFEWRKKLVLIWNFDRNTQ